MASDVTHIVVAVIIHSGDLVNAGVRGGVSADGGGIRRVDELWWELVTEDGDGNWHSACCRQRWRTSVICPNVNLKWNILFSDKDSENYSDIQNL